MAATRSNRAVSETGDPLLLTPGPLTTSKSVKRRCCTTGDRATPASSRSTARCWRGCRRSSTAGDDYVTVPMQGSGTFAVEAMLTSFVPPDGGVLLLVNGAYGQRAKRILRHRRGAASWCTRPPRTRRPISTPWTRILRDTAGITHVFAVHCETTSGIRTRSSEIAAIAARHGKRLLIDAMSAFGALPLDAAAPGFDAVAASSNKCIEGVPGLGFVVCRRDALAATKGNATTLVLDLHDQWQALGRPASTASPRRSTSSSPSTRR